MSIIRAKAKNSIDLNLKHLRAITLFQDLYQDKKRITTRLNDKLDTIYSTLMSVTNNLSNNYITQVITQETYKQSMQKTDELLQCYEQIPNPLRIRDLNYDIKLDITALEYQTIELIKTCGANTIYDILRIMVGPDWDLGIRYSHMRLLQLYNSMFVPKMVKITNVSDSTDLMPEVKKYSSYTSSIILKVHGAEISIPVHDKILIIKGYFRDDPLNISRIGGTIGQKYDDLTIALHQNKLAEIDFNFKNRYVEQISLRDFVCLTVEQLSQTIHDSYQELTKMKEKTLSQLADSFTKSKTKNQSRIITLLLLDENSHKMARSLIGMLSSQDSEEMTQIYRLLHWQIQNIFDDVAKNIERSVIDIGSTEDSLPYDIRIDNMKCSESIRRKARDKLKEIKNSRDGNDKATKYLDAILRIPFGICRKESILRFIGEFREELKTLIDELNEYQKTEEDNLDEVVNEMISKLGQRRIETANDIDKCVNEIAEYLSHLLQLKDQLSEMDAAEMLLASSPSSGIIGMPDPNEHLLEFRNRLIRSHRKWEDFKVERRDYMKTVSDKLENCLYKQTDAKHKISSLIAQWINGEMEGAVFGFCGYPGTGKTTLAKHGLSNCLLDEAGNSRPIVFIPLGGSTHSSTLDGHNFTYVGSRWGKIADGLMEAKIMNPIIYFDELDKVSETPHGHEIVHFLTHLTDPEQNNQVMDKYFNIEMDLSKALIVFSYNDSSKIDEILMQRITEIPFMQYNVQEKTHIGENHLLPKILKTVGYTKEELIFSTEIIEYIAGKYTHEAGVRELKEKLMEIVREVNIRRITDEDDYPLPFTVEENLVDDILKRKNKITLSKIPPKSQVGWVNGLYATALGTGGLTVIQVFDTLSEKKYSIELTGKLGDVMKESVRCAKTIGWKLLPASVKKALDEEWKDNPYGLHIHFPAAGTSKDGPSAGAAITTAIISFFCKRPFRRYIAMTGEIDLYGNVRAIGGLQSKIEGAIRAGVKIALIPKENEGCWVDIKDNYADAITVQTVENISQIIELVLVTSEGDDAFQHIHDITDDPVISGLRNKITELDLEYNILPEN